MIRAFFYRSTFAASILTAASYKPETLPQMIQVLDEHGFDGMARAIQILVNEAMKIERSEVLGAEPYERTSERLGYANAQ